MLHSDGEVAVIVYRTGELKKEETFVFVLCTHSWSDDHYDQTTQKRRRKLWQERQSLAFAAFTLIYTSFMSVFSAKLEMMLHQNEMKDKRTWDSVPLFSPLVVHCLHCEVHWMEFQFLSSPLLQLIFLYSLRESLLASLFVLIFHSFSCSSLLQRICEGTSFMNEMKWIEKKTRLDMERFFLEILDDWYERIYTWYICYLRVWKRILGMEE